MSAWFVYLLRCRDGSLYCGITSDLKRRLSQHNSGKGAKYIIPARRPVKCVWKTKVKDKSTALKLEYQVKQCSRRVKLAIIKKGHKDFV